MTLPVHSQSLRLDLQRRAEKKDLDKVSLVAREIFKEMNLTYGPNDYTQNDANKLINLLHGRFENLSGAAALSLLSIFGSIYLALATLDWKYFALLCVCVANFKGSDIHAGKFKDYTKEMEKLKVYKTPPVKCTIM